MHKLSLLMTCLLLTACGWRLQGVRRVPEALSPLYLELPDTHSAFAQALQQRLQAAGVVLADRRDQSQSVLQVSEDDSGHHVSSVSILNVPQQYEVYYNLQYRLVLPTGGDAVITPQTLSAARTMSYDKTLALAKQREEFALRDTLASELADQVLRRLSMLPATTVVPAAPILTD